MMNELETLIWNGFMKYMIKEHPEYTDLFEKMELRMEEEL